MQESGSLQSVVDYELKCRQISHLNKCWLQILLQPAAHKGISLKFEHNCAFGGHTTTWPCLWSRPFLMVISGIRQDLNLSWGDSHLILRSVQTLLYDQYTQAERKYTKCEIPEINSNCKSRKNSMTSTTQWYSDRQSPKIPMYFHQECNV